MLHVCVWGHVCESHVCLCVWSWLFVFDKKTVTLHVCNRTMVCWSRELEIRLLTCAFAVYVFAKHVMIVNLAAWLQCSTQINCFKHMWHQHIGFWSTWRCPSAKVTIIFWRSKHLKHDVDNVNIWHMKTTWQALWNSYLFDDFRFCELKSLLFCMIFVFASWNLHFFVRNLFSLNLQF